MELSENCMRTIARYVAEYIYPGDPIMEKTGHSGDPNRYNVLNSTLYEVHDANEKLDKLLEKSNGGECMLSKLVASSD